MATELGAALSGLAQGLGKFVSRKMEQEYVKDQLKLNQKYKEKKIKQQNLNNILGSDKTMQMWALGGTGAVERFLRMNQEANRIPKDTDVEEVVSKYDSMYQNMLSSVAGTPERDGRGGAVTTGEGSIEAGTDISGEVVKEQALGQPSKRKSIHDVFSPSEKADYIKQILGFEVDEDVEMPSAEEIGQLQDLGLEPSKAEIGPMTFESPELESGGDIAASKERRLIKGEARRQVKDIGTARNYFATTAGGGIVINKDRATEARNWTPVAREAFEQEMLHEEGIEKDPIGSSEDYQKLSEQDLLNQVKEANPLAIMELERREPDVRQFWQENVPTRRFIQYAEQKLDKVGNNQTNKYKTADDVIKALKANDIDMSEAEKILKENFEWDKEKKTYIRKK